MELLNPEGVNVRIEQKLAIPLFLIAIGNFIKWITRSGSLIDLIFFVLPFIVMSILFITIKFTIGKRLSSISMLIFSLSSAIPADMNSLNVIFFFLFSIAVFKLNKYLYWVYGLLISTIMMIRFAVLKLGSSSTINYLAASVFIILFFQHYILPKLNKKNSTGVLLKTYDSRKVKDCVVDIIQLRIQGFDWWEINVKLELNINDSELPRKIREERKRLKFKTQDQFNFWLFKNGIIQSVSDESNMRA